MNEYTIIDEIMRRLHNAADRNNGMVSINMVGKVAQEVLLDELEGIDTLSGRGDDFFLGDFDDDEDDFSIPFDEFEEDEYSEPWDDCMNTYIFDCDGCEYRTFCPYSSVI